MKFSLAERKKMKQVVTEETQEELDLGMPSSPRTFEDYARLNGMINQNLLRGKPYQSPAMRICIFLIGFMLVLPVVVTILNLATGGSGFEAGFNLIIFVLLAIPGSFLIYRSLRG